MAGDVSIFDGVARTFLRESEITRPAVISHSIYRRSRVRYLLGGVRFQRRLLDFHLNLTIPYRSPTDRELFSDEREKASPAKLPQALRIFLRYALWRPMAVSQLPGLSENSAKRDCSSKRTMFCFNEHCIIYTISFPLFNI